MQISISELKVNTSSKQVVAHLIPVTAPAFQALLGNIPNVHWMGKKPNLNRIRPTLRGKYLADTMLEMR